MHNDVDKILEGLRHFDPPEERVVRVGDDSITLLVYAEGTRTYLDAYDRAMLEDDGSSDPYYEPTKHYRAPARVKHDPSGRLKPGRFVLIKAFENYWIGFGDTESVQVEAQPGEVFPQGPKILT